jgi:hypothetical protein
MMCEEVIKGGSVDEMSKNLLGSPGEATSASPGFVHSNQRATTSSLSAYTYQHPLRRAVGAPQRGLRCTAQR